MENCKTFYEVQIASNLKEIIQPPLNPLIFFSPDKTLLRLWNKYFLTGIYRNMKTFPFKVLQECSSWASRNGIYLFILFSLYLTLTKYRKQKNTCLQ